MPTPALHPHPFFRINGYNVTSLPFAPTAINDSGVIVGRMYSSSTDSSAEVAVAYFGSTLTVLPPPAGLTGSYSALDISSSGHVLGTGGGSMLIWPGRASAPLVVGHLDSLAGFAMNDHDMVVGVTNDGFAFRWQPPYTLAYLHVPFGYTNPYPFHVTNSGYITGTVRSSFSRARYTIRWAPNGTPTVFSAGPSYPAGLHDNGDVLLATFFGSYQTLIWPASGSVRSVTGIPGTPVAAWSSAGRYAGDFGPSQTREPWTLYNGSLTWLPAGDLNTQLVDGVDENACGTIIATRDLFATPVTEDSGYMWRRLFTCDLSGTLAGGTSVASPSTAALP